MCFSWDAVYIYIYVYIYIHINYIYILCIHIKIYILFFDNKKWCVFFVRAPGLEAGGHSRGANWADGESDVMMLLKCMVAYIFCCEAWSNYENLQKSFQWIPQSRGEIHVMSIYSYVSWNLNIQINLHEVLLPQTYSEPTCVTFLGASRWVSERCKGETIRDAGAAPGRWVWTRFSWVVRWWFQIFSRWWFLDSLFGGSKSCITDWEYVR